MKVLVISHSAVVELYREKFRALARLGCELHLVLPAGWPEGGRWVDAPAPGLEGGVQVHVLPVRWAGRVGFFTLPGLSRLIRRIAPDLVHVEEEPYSFTCWQALRQARRLGAPAIFFTWENIRRRYRPPLNWLLRRNLVRADRAIAGNRDAEQVLRAHGFRGPVDVIPQYGVDPDGFRRLPEVRRQRDEIFAIGYLGRLREEKGIHTLLRACARLDFLFRLLITGSGEYELKLRNLVRGLHLEPRVWFQPAVGNRQMPRALNRLDALVLPSETRRDWKEQFGRVLTEAMACEVPVIGSSSGEIPQVLGDAGLIFPEGDVDGLARQLARLQGDPGLAAELARRGRERVLARYTTESLARQTLEIYRQALPGRA